MRSRQNRGNNPSPIRLGASVQEVARDDTRWKKMMGLVEGKGGSVTLSVLTQILTDSMKRGLEAAREALEALCSLAAGAGGRRDA